MVRPTAYLAVMPGFVPFPLQCVYVSGALEALGGLGVLIPNVRRPAGWGLVLLLIVVFPANIQMAWDAVVHAKPLWVQALLLARLPLQWPLILWVVRAADLRRPTQDRVHQL